MSKSVILIGGGKSVLAGVDLGLWDKIKNHEIWSLNYAYKFMPYLPSREVWVDRAFFERNLNDVENLWKNGVKLLAKKDTIYAEINHDMGEVIAQYQAVRKPGGFKGVHALKELDKFMYSGSGGLCGIFALSVAFAEGYDKIYLLGYDFGTPVIGDKKTHWYQDLGFNGFSTGVGNPEVYNDMRGNMKWKEDFEIYLPNMDEFKIEVFNVSPESNIKTFQKIDYNQFFEKLNG